MTDFWVLEQLLERVQQQEKRRAEVTRLQQAWEEHETVSAALLTTMARWIAAEVKATGRQGALLGVSGGVDSTLGAIAVQQAVGARGLGVIIPDASSDPADEADATRLCKLIGLEYQVVRIGDAMDQLLAAMGDARTPDTRRNTGNMASRVRIAVQYYVANMRDCLVVGCGDIDEVYVGYSSKGLAADVHPQAGLHKDEVRQLVYETLSPLDEGFARHMSQRPATPGFWPGQKAEEQLGITYTRIGPAVDVMARHCTLRNDVLFPEDVEAFLEALGSSGVSPQEFIQVVDIFFKFYDTSYHSPSLSRPRDLAPLRAKDVNVLLTPGPVATP